MALRLCATFLAMSCAHDEVTGCCSTGPKPGREVPGASLIQNSAAFNCISSHADHYANEGLRRSASGDQIAFVCTEGAVLLLDALRTAARYTIGTRVDKAEHHACRTAIITDGCCRGAGPVSADDARRIHTPGSALWHGAMPHPPLSRFSIPWSIFHPQGSSQCRCDRQDALEPKISKVRYL